MKPTNICLLLVTSTTLLFGSCSATSEPTTPANAASPATATPHYEPRSRHTSPASTFTGRVVSVADGDTIVVLNDTQRSYEIRLQGIDAPEGGQAFGDRSRQNLTDLMGGEEVSVRWSKRDRYGRIVGEVSINGRDICLEQIKAGMAWHYKYYQSEQTPGNRVLYAQAEVEAKTSRRGLWIDANPVPPWDFRNRR